MSHKLRFSMLLTICMVTAFLGMAGCNKKKQEDKQISAKTNKSIKTRREAKVETNSDATTVKLQTNKGDIIIELNKDAAPVSVENFLRYVNEGFYDGTIFHRVIKGFMIQGGGFTQDMKQKRPHEQIKNEASNGLKNDRGTLAMARTNNPNSATSQFFINHKDNDFLNYAGPAKPGYAVFAKVIDGMEVVDVIAAVKTTGHAHYQDVPAEPVIIEKATILAE